MKRQYPIRNSARLALALLFSYAPLAGIDAHAQGPGNDHFANAVVISGNFGQVDGTTVGATNEAGEPEESHTLGGIWYRWTSPGFHGRLTLALEVFGPINHYHYLHSYYDRTGSIFDLIPLGSFHMGGGSISSDSLQVAPNTTYYFRVGSESTSNRRSPIQFTLNFSPIYRTGVVFRSPSSTLRGKRATVTAKVLSPSNASSVAAYGSGKGRATNVRYNGGNGTVTFTHKRVGRAPKGRRAIARSKVTYTVVAYKAGQESGRATKRFSVR